MTPARKSDAPEEAAPEAEEAAAAEVKRGELTGAVIKGGAVHLAGTKAAELDLTDSERGRLERLGLIKK